MNYRKALYDNYVKSQILPSDGDIFKNLLSPRKTFLTNLIKQHFPIQKNAKILDLGCGHGAMLYFANEMGYTNLKGIDCSEQQVEIAHKLNLDFIELGSIELCLKEIPANSIDLIVTFDVIEHMQKQEAYDFAKKIYSILSSSGKWIIHVPNAESPFGNRMRHWDYTHELAFTQKSLAQLLACVGFIRHTFYEDTPAIHGIKSCIRWVLWKLIRNMLNLYLIIETGSGNGVFSQNLLAIAYKKDK